MEPENPVNEPIPEPTTEQAEAVMQDAKEKHEEKKPLNKWKLAAIIALFVAAVSLIILGAVIKGKTEAQPNAELQHQLALVTAEKNSYQNTVDRLVNYSNAQSATVLNLQDFIMESGRYNESLNWNCTDSGICGLEYKGNRYGRFWELPKIEISSNQTGG